MVALLWRVAKRNLPRFRPARRAALLLAPLLELAADKAGWGKPLPAGRARGVALHEAFGSIVAQVVEVAVANGPPRVHRVVCAADVGTVVNPGIVAQQMESAIVFGLTAALHGRIDIHDGVVRQPRRHPPASAAASPCTSRSAACAPT